MTRHIVDTAEVVSRGIKEMSEILTTTQERISHYERALESVTIERDMLKEQIENLKRDYKEELTTVRDERDYYQRQSVEFCVSLGSIGMFAEDCVSAMHNRINEIINRAKDAPYAQTITRAPPAVLVVPEEPKQIETQTRESEPASISEQQAAQIELEIAEIHTPKIDDPPPEFLKRPMRKNNRV